MKGQTQLLAEPTREKWSGSRALVPIVRGVCPSCGHATITVTVGEPPLLRHGGYGAMRETVHELCTRPPLGESWCRWSLVRSVTEVKP